MFKNQKQAIAVLIAVLAVFTICVFAISFPKGGTFWIAYIAEIIAIASQIPIFKLAFDNRDALRNKILGFPIFRVEYIYLGVQTAASVILFILSSVVKAFPAWISLIFCVIILTGAFVFSIAADIAMDSVEIVKIAQVINTDFIKKCA